MKDLLIENASAVISVCGTLCGTILGWILAKINLGRIHMEIDDFKTHTTYLPNGIGAESELSDIEITFSIKLFNSSDQNMVLREFFIVCLDNKKKQVYKDAPKDKDTQGLARSYDAAKYVEVINIPGNSGVDIHAGCRIQLLEEFLKSQTIYLCYKTGKMRQKKKLIVKRDFSYIKMKREDMRNNG